jgi:tetratricopeptide (TPR) repeat protein
MGDIHQDHDRLDEALVSFKRAQELKPEDPNTYGNLSTLERDNNNLAAALNWMLMASEIDPRDHELAAIIANTLYELELPEEGDRWAARVNALVPGSAAARSVALNRARARKDFDTALMLSQSMIAEQVDMRGGFGNALFEYTELMMQANRSKEAWDFLVSIRPEISNFDELPNDLQAAFMQFAGVMLMTGFESFETRKQAWLKVSGHLDAKGFPWRDPGHVNNLIDMVILGEADKAVEYYLDSRLSKPMATNPHRHKQGMKQFYGALYSDPRVVVRLSELDQEYAQLQNEIRELMLEPEWNQ